MSHYTNPLSNEVSNYENTIHRMRERTGALVMDCRKALNECDNDEEAAAEYLIAHSGARSI